MHYKTREYADREVIIPFIYRNYGISKDFFVGIGMEADILLGTKMVFGGETYTGDVTKGLYRDFGLNLITELGYGPVGLRLRMGLSNAVSDESMKDKVNSERLFSMGVNAHIHFFAKARISS